MPKWETPVAAGGPSVLLMGAICIPGPVLESGHKSPQRGV